MKEESESIFVGINSQQPSFSVSQMLTILFDCISVSCPSIDTQLNRCILWPADGFLFTTRLSWWLSFGSLFSGDPCPITWSKQIKFFKWLIAFLSQHLEAIFHDIICLLECSGADRLYFLVHCWYNHIVRQIKRSGWLSGVVNWHINRVVFAYFKWLNRFLCRWKHKEYITKPFFQVGCERVKVQRRTCYVMCFLLTGF